jgi:hypothetical protein
MATKIKCPAKKAAKLKPLRLQGAGIQLGSDRLAEVIFITIPAKVLNDHLRARSIGIPKSKTEAAKRLAAWCVREGARFDLFLA